MANKNKPKPDVSIASLDPADFVGKLIKPSQAATALGVSSPRITSLNRRGVIRKFGSHFWGGYLKDDVDRLEEVYNEYGDSSDEARELERRMSREHLTDALRKISSSKLAEMREDVADLSAKGYRLVKQLGSSDKRDKLDDVKYQFMYLTDSEAASIHSALMYRKALVSLSQNGLKRFEVNRVSLPPVRYWTDESASQIVDMLLATAEDYYGIKFDFIDEADYQAIHKSSARKALLNYFHGSRVQNDTFVSDVKTVTENGEYIPTLFKVVYWYRALRRLVGFGRMHVGSDRLVVSLCEAMSGQKEASDISEQHTVQTALNTLTGVLWGDMYVPRWFPVYVGEPPYTESSGAPECHLVSPANKKFSDLADLDELPVRAKVRLRAQIEFQKDGSMLSQNNELQARLAYLHLNFLAVTAKVNSPSKEIGVATTFMKALFTRGIKPSELFEEPFEHATNLLSVWDSVEDAFSETFGVLIDSGYIPEAKALNANAIALSEDIGDRAMTKEQEALITSEVPEITDQDREVMSALYFEANGIEVGIKGAEWEDHVTKEELDKFILEQWGY